MKRLTILLLLCALLLTGCAILRPKDHILDGDGMEKPAPEAVPTDDEIEAMRPKLILDGCEMLGMDIKETAQICIDGMREHAAELGLTGTEN